MGAGGEPPGWYIEDTGSGTLYKRGRLLGEVNIPSPQRWPRSRTPGQPLTPASTPPPSCVSQTRTPGGCRGSCSEGGGN